MPEQVREHENIVEIDAPIEEVWKAITEAQEIARWFAPKMTVEPGAGGFVLAEWGPNLHWKTVIEVWEPNKHLRTVEVRDHIMTAAPDAVPLEPCRLVQDYYLEAKGGKTVLRLVHSGFGTSSKWDQEYEGTRDGWAGCFLRLKSLLERHKSDSVHNGFLTAMCYGIDHLSAMRQIEEAAPTPFDVTLRGKTQISGFLRDWNDSVVSISVQPSATGSVAYVEMILYGLSEQKAAEVENAWKATLAKLFSASSQPAVASS